MEVTVNPTEEQIQAVYRIQSYVSPEVAGFVAVRVDEDGRIVSYWKGGYDGEAIPSEDPLADEPYLFLTPEKAQKRVEKMAMYTAEVPPYLGIWIYPDWYPEQRQLERFKRMAEGHQLPGSAMQGARLGYIEGWVVTQDGETLAYGFWDDAEAMKWLHDHQSGSVDYAVRHGGYDILLIEDGKVSWSYKRDILPQTAPEMGAIELVELGDGMPEDFHAEYELGAKVRKRTPLAKAKKTAAKVERWIKPFAQRLMLVGSIRRKRPEVGDIEFVLLSKKSLGVEGLAEELDELGFHVTPRTATQIVDGIKVDIYIAYKPEEFGGMVFMYTGDRTFNFAMRKKVMQMGYLLNQYGIWTRDKSRAIFQSPDEKDFFEFLKLPYHTPQERSFKHRTPEERRRAKARQARMKGVMSGDEEAFFTRLESVWGDPVGEES